MNETTRTPPDTPSPTRSRPRRVLRWVAGAVGFVLALLVVAVAGTFLYLRTDFGLIRLAALIGRVASTPEVELRVGRLAGSFPQHLRVEDVTLRDERGILIHLDHAELRWRPSRLLRRHLDIALIDIGTLTVNRLPTTPPAAETPAEQPFQLPRLPVDITVERFRLDELALSPEVAGQPARLTAEAELLATRTGEFSAKADARTLTEPVTRLALDAGYDARTNYLKLHLDAAEAEGGVIGGLLGLPGTPALRLEADGEAPLHDWRGRLRGSAGTLASADVTVRLDGQAPLRVGVAGGLDVAGLLPPDQARLVAGGVTIEASAEVLPQLIRLNEATLVTAAGSLSARGTFAPETAGVDAEATLALGPATVFAVLAPGLGYDRIEARARVTGSLPGPNVQLALVADGLASGDARVGGLEFKARASPTASAGPDGGPPPFDLEAELVARDIVPPTRELRPLVRDPVRVVVDGRFDPATSRALIRSLNGNAGPIALAATADVTLGERPSGTLALHTNEVPLAPFSELAGFPVDGRARLEGRLSAAEDGRFEFTLNADAHDFASSRTELAALLGRTPTLRANAKGDLDSTIDVDANVRTAQFQAAAEGRVAADLSAIERARVRLDADDLRGLEPIIGAPIAGRFQLNAEASGPMTRLTGTLRATGGDILYQDQRVTRLNLAIDANAVADGTEGTLALDALTSLGDVTARSAFRLEGSSQVRLERFVLTHANALTATADLVIPLDGRPIAGTMAVSSPDLTPVGRALGQELAGRLRLDLALDQLRGVQRVSADLRAEDLAVGPPTARSLEVGAVRASAQLLDPWDERRLRATLDAETVRAADGEFTRATARAEGGNDRYALEARGQGNLQGLTQLAVQGDVRLGRITTVTLGRLEGRFHGEPLSLPRPARIEFGEGRLRVEDLALALGRARATLTLLKAPDRVQGRFTLREFDLSLIGKFQPGLDARGVLSADANLTGSPSAPTLIAEARAERVRLGTTRQAPRAPALVAILSATIGNGRLNASLDARGLGEEPLVARVSAPLRFGIAPFVFALDDTQPIEGRVAWRGEVAPLMQLLPIDAFLLSGYAAVDLAIGGTMRRPLVNGDVSLDRGGLELFATGTLLRPLEVAVTARGEEWRLTRLEARDGGSGTLSGTGVVVLGDPLRLDARLDLAGFTALRRDDVVSKVDGNVTVEGAVGERLLVAGRIENQHTEVRLVNRLPPSVVTVEVTFTDELAEPVSPPPGTPAEPGAAWVHLDLTVDLPGRVYVRGRGLESEWAGTLAIAGTAAKPQVRGRLEPVRGDFDLLGKRFTLTRGRIGIDGLDQEITIDLTATYKRSDLEARVIVSGTAAKPRITLESTPELPQDEILARVLFDKSTGRLGAGEAAQLAMAAATLASGEPGALDALRTATGLDRLTFGSAPEGGGLGTLEAGKNIGESVYVGVEQGLSATSGAAVVEVDITDNIKLRSSTSAEGSNRVGVRWEWDY